MALVSFERVLKILEIILTVLNAALKAITSSSPTIDDSE